MKTAEEILKQKLAESLAAGKSSSEDRSTAILQAMEEYAEYRVTKALEPWNAFMDKLEKEVETDRGTTEVGEFVMNHFDLWL